MKMAEQIVDYNVKTWEIITGRKYDKLVKVQPSGGRSAVAFILRASEDAYFMAAGWAKRGRRMTREERVHYAEIVRVLRS